MKTIGDFLSVVISQREYLDRIIEHEQDCSHPKFWSQRLGKTVMGAQRRGWTRRDKVRHEYYEASALTLPSIHRPSAPPPARPKRIGGRIEMLFRKCKYQDSAVVVAKAALDCCKSNPHIVRSAGGAVSEMLATHLRWLDYLQAEKGYPSNIETEWDDCKCRLQGIWDVIRDIEAEQHRERVPLSDLAKEFGVSRSTIYRIMEKGYLVTYGEPKFVYRDEINPVEIERLLELQQKRQLPNKNASL